MKVRDFLDKLLFKLGEGDLHFVATQLKSYFRTIQQDNFWIKQSEEILDSLKDVNINANYTEETKKLKIQTVKEDLQKIISSIKDRTNVDSSLSNLPSDELQEEFEGLVDLQKGTIKVRTKGGRGTLGKSIKSFILGLIILSVIIILGYYFMNPKQPEKPEITNCDCAKIESLKSNSIKEIEQNKKNVDSLNVEIVNLERKGLNEKRIKLKEKVLTIKRNYLSRIDSLEGLILPEVESLINQCPFQDCNNSIDNLILKLK